ncbi:MAG TPA: thioester reductase domain-containing protein [Myxococcaceae bacterium]|nr:thioester reductase domain-containing protein [Myxococcaceae bacterium]
MEGREPVAIVGIGCRFPGAEGPQAFWRLLRDGVDVVTEVPSSRFNIEDWYDPRPGTPGKIITKGGGYLPRVDQFDAGFFGISPREAAKMDPQQRLLLEVAWEALEDAGQVPSRIVGSRTGVFISTIYNDYEDLLIRDPQSYDIYAYTGGARSSLSGRLSYCLGLRGPSVVVDTACSSSLVAIHLACQSLWTGEAPMALAGACNLILTPEYSLGFSSAKMLAPDGRCKAFDARGNGFVRSEGVAMVALKPLRTAQADGDPIYAVIRGTAVNNDGKCSGFMTPSREGQEELLREAYRSAGVNPARVQYVEAHGTGTVVGDPVEVGAIGAVLGRNRPKDRPCFLGSVKTNIGHTEGAAGMAGIIKVALALKHKELPKSLHLESPNPAIPWSELPIAVVKERMPWPQTDGPALAGVSSFGISGTNAHVVVQEAPPPEPVAEEAAAPVVPQLLTLAAHTPDALKAMAESYRRLLKGESGPPQDLRQICYTASVRREHHDHRLALVAKTADEAAEQLQAFAAGEQRMGMSSGVRRPGRQRKVVFVFPGQGSQWAGMGKQLLETEPVFRGALERCDRRMRGYLGGSIIEEVLAPPEKSRLDEIGIVQPALFAIEVALAALWQSWGVDPDAVVGHSMGEVAAAHVAGALSLADAAQIICKRSALMRQVAGKGAMAAVDLTLEEARAEIAGVEDKVSIGVSNGPQSTVLSGDPTVLNEILARLQKRGIFCRPIKVTVASHSPQMDPLKDEFFASMKGLSPKVAEVPFCSTVVRAFGKEAMDGLELNAEYWWQNLRNPVLFFDAIQMLLRSGHDIFLEMSPHPILAMPLTQSIAHAAKGGIVLPSMRREEDARAVMLGSFGALYTQGREMELDRLYPQGGKVVPLPQYPWQREKFWFERKGSERQSTDGRRSRPTGGIHPMLGAHLVSAADSSSHLWEMDLALDSLPYLTDHRVQGAAVLPGAAYLEMAVAAATEAFGAKRFALEKVAFKKALVLPEQGAQTVQLVYSQETAATASFRFFSRPAEKDSQEPWTLLAQGMMRIFGQNAPAPSFPAPEDLRARLPETRLGDDHYREMKGRGLEYGPAFQAVQQVWRRNGESLATLKLGDAAAQKADAYHVHPALLDAALQVAYAAMPKDVNGQPNPDTWLPVGVRTLRLHGRAGDAGWAHTTLRPVPGGTTSLEADVRLLDDAGHVVAEVLGLALQRLEENQQRAAERHLRDWLYRIRWEPLARPSKTNRPTKKGTWLVFVDAGGVGKALAALLAERGERCVLVSPAKRAREPQRLDGDRVTLRPGMAEDYKQLLKEFVAPNAQPLRGVVHLWSLDAAEPEDTNLTSLEEAQNLGAVSILHVVQALSSAGLPAGPRLWLVTSGSQRVDEGEQRVAVAQAPAWGMGGVIAYEHPDLRPVRVDLGREPALGEIRSLFHEISQGGEEDQVSLRGDARYVARLVKVTEEEIQPETRGPKRPATGKERPYRLEIPNPGVLDNLSFRAVRRRRPGPGEVEIEVCVAGLNFRDVMLSLGLIPPVVDGRLDLGWECSGRVAAVGEGVRHLAVGDEVVAVAPPCFGAYATTSAHLVHRKPANLSMADGATIPIAFLTAYYALQTQGRISKGERVLIHAATGGVGLAAVQIAQWAEAEIFATAGNPVKREYLEGLGIAHVMDSRSVTFAEHVMDVTSGEGVDLVLNSLAGDFIPKSFSLLRAGGRFLELGNVDMVRNSAFGLRNFQNNRSFFGVNLGVLAMTNPARCGVLLSEVMALFEQGVFQPLPSQSFPVAHAPTAFRHMAQARHIGKVVINFEDQAVVTTESADAPLEFAEEATYLITGGMGGLGLQVAQWMLSRGARHLVLMGRHAPSPTAQAAIDAMRRTQGAEVAVVKADVADERQVAGVLTAIARKLPPLKGIFHAAGFLDDGILLQMTPERFKAVMAPKVQGAWNLHALTQELPLDHFVLFSSAASVLGSPGQANYVAGNAFLDALAAHRQALKLPVLTVNWCPWTEVGLAARPDRAGRLAVRGLGSISPKEGIPVLERLLRQSLGQVAVMPFDVQQWEKFYPQARQLQLFAELARAQKETPAVTSAAPTKTARQALLAASADKRESWLQDYLREQVSKALRLPAGKLDARTPLNKLGIDSLMAVELNNRIEADLGATVPVVRLLEGISVTEVAAHLLQQLPPPGEESAAEAEAEEAEAQAEAAAAEETEAETETEAKAAVEEEEAPAEPRETLSGDEVEALLEEMVETGTLKAVSQRPGQRGNKRGTNQIRPSETARVRSSRRRPNLESEVVLDPAIVANGPVASTSNPVNILVTGGTGFLGAFLIHDMLRQTQATAHCLVRASDAAEGKRRLKQTLETYRLWDEGFSSRVVPVLGDLGKPLLGLTPETFGDLAHKVDSIYHSGALVNFLFSYADARPANVGGTHEILRLAATGPKVKPVHHISSASVFSTDENASKKMMETDELPRSEGLLMGGYAQSKWVSERLVMAARARGIPASIYRPVFIGWHSQTGVFHKTDFLCCMLRGCLQMGAAPDIDMVWYMAPVDFVSRAIIHLSRRPEALGNNFHLINPTHLLWNDLVETLRGIGLPLERMSYKAWRQKLLSEASSSRDNALRVFAPLFPESENGLSFFEVMSERRMPMYDWQNVQLGISDSGLTCPPIDAKTLRVFLDELVVGAGAVASPPPPGLSSAEIITERMFPGGRGT